MLDITVQNNEIEIGEKALRKMKELKEFQLTVLEMKNQEQEIKESLLKAMEENGIKSFKNEFMSIVYVPESERRTADTKKMKDDGIFDDYSKTSKTKAYVKISYEDAD